MFWQETMSRGRRIERSDCIQIRTYICLCRFHNSSKSSACQTYVYIFVYSDGLSLIRQAVGSLKIPLHRGALYKLYFLQDSPLFTEQGFVDLTVYLAFRRKSNSPARWTSNVVPRPPRHQEIEECLLLKFGHHISHLSLFSSQLLRKYLLRFGRKSCLVVVGSKGVAARRQYPTHSEPTLELLQLVSMKTSCLVFKKDRHFKFTQIIRHQTSNVTMSRNCRELDHVERM